MCVCPCVCAPVCVSLPNIGKVDQIEYIATQTIDSLRQRKKFALSVDVQLVQLLSKFSQISSHLSPADSVMEHKNGRNNSTSAGIEQVSL